MQRQSVVLLICALVLASCAVPDPGTRVNPGAPLPAGPTPTPNLGEPDGVAEAFLNAWTGRNYEGMYSLLTPNSQAEYSLEEFTSIYTSAATTMTLIDLQAVPLSTLPDTTGTTARLAFRVTYNTQVLGPIEEDLIMNLLLADDRWGISWTPGLIFPEMAGGNSIQLEVEIPSRANIYDRNGLVLVSANASAVTLSVVPGQVSPDWESQMLDLLSQVLRRTPEEIRQNYEGYPADWFQAVGDVDMETYQANRSALNSYPALHSTEKTGRRYFDLLASHVTGYTGFIPEGQIDSYRARGYQGDEIVGLSGLELWGENYLAGTRGGVLSAYTPNGQFLTEIAQRDPQPAQSLYTTLDRPLQAAVQDAIEDAYRAGATTWAPTANGAAAVVIDVHTGEVLAMASYPYFDPNVLNPYNSHPLLTDTYVSDLLNDPRRPFLNRATQGQYPPGSLFKIVGLATALGSGIFQASDTYTCTGVWTEMGAENPRYDWLEDGHGTLTLQQALTASCNPYFYHIGFVTGQQDYNLIPGYAREFGLGSDLGLQIEEESGLIPDPDWLWQERGAEWTLADSVNIAIGQGDVLVTPLQMATAIATIANGGTVYRPQFVQKIGLIGEDPSVVFEPEVLNTLSLSPEQIETMRTAMHGVTSDPTIGTAQYRIGTMQISSAGKTGTAQVSQPGSPPIAWFGGYAPYEDPQIAVVVVIENGGQGSAVAAPIFRRIVENYFHLPVAEYPPDWNDPSIFRFVDDTIGE